MKTGTVHVKEEREEVSQVNSSSNAEPGYSEKLQNEDLIYSISPLTNTRLTEFRSEMITLINKNGDQPVPLGDRNSYYEDLETNNVPKAEKGKTGDTHSYELPALFKNNAENNNTGAVVRHQKDQSKTMTVVLTLRQKFRVIRIRSRPCMTLR